MNPFLFLILSAVLLWVMSRNWMKSPDPQGGWLVPALMGLSALLGAKGKQRQEGNNAEASRYQAQRQNEVDRYSDALAKAKRGERVRYANALAKSRGFVVPQLDTAASEGEKLQLPEVPKFKSGGFLEQVGAGLAGASEGIMSEANLNASRGSLPASPGQPTGGPSLTSTGITSAFDPQQGDSYSRFLSRTPYFSGPR